MSEADLAAESKQRAAEIDGASPLAAAEGVQPAANDEDAVLAQLDAKYGLPEGEGEGDYADADSKPVTWTKEERVRVRDEKGRFTADEATQAAKAPEPEEEPTEEQPAPETDQSRDSEAERVDGDELERALRALRRDRWSDEDLKLLTDRDIVRIGQTRASEQRKVDEKIDDFARRLDPKAQASAAGEDSEPKEPSADEVAAWEKVQGILSSSLVDEDAAKDVTSALRTALVQSQARRAPEQPANGAMLEALLDERARARLGERFPKLKSDDSLWGEISRKAASIHRAYVSDGVVSPGLSGVDEAFTDAARAMLGDPAAIAAAQDRKQAQKAREQAQPTRAQARQPARSKPKSRDELDDLWLNAREKGDADEVRRLEALYSEIPAAG